jgi:hypothetical protein
MSTTAPQNDDSVLQYQYDISFQLPGGFNVKDMDLISYNCGYCEVDELTITLRILMIFSPNCSSPEALLLCRHISGVTIVH